MVALGIRWIARVIKRYTSRRHISGMPHEVKNAYVSL
jgi:hypothetical protein